MEVKGCCGLCRAWATDASVSLGWFGCVTLHARRMHASGWDVRAGCVGQQGVAVHRACLAADESS